MSHGSAFLTECGRLALAQCVVDDRWPVRRAAERFNCSPATAKKWADRYLLGGTAAVADRSSRPRRSPNQTRQRRERRIIALRFSAPVGSSTNAAHLRVPRSTVAGPCCAATGCRCYATSTSAPGCLCANHGHIAISAAPQAISFIATSNSSAASRTAVGTASSIAVEKVLTGCGWRPDREGGVRASGNGGSGSGASASERSGSERSGSE